MRQSIMLGTDKGHVLLGAGLVDAQDHMPPVEG